MDESLIIELWDVFKEYVPEKNRETAANHYVDFLLGKDVDEAILEGLTGYDPHLDDAIQLALGDESDNSEEEIDDYYDEDEDY